ncbi:integrator complex subunit 1-like [Rhopilema esculentum]|uniref:integrator complex subunit 1-like n=1 Tax=Rhopilema esculentum TaxID=499914 RepID=UPI0031E0A769
MEKSRMQQSKNRAKSRGLPPPGDFIALGSKSRASTSELDSKAMPPLSRKPAQVSTSVVSSSQATIALKEKRKDLPATLSLHAPTLQKQGKLPTGLFSPSSGKNRSSPQGHRILENDSPIPPVVLLEANPVDLEYLVMEAAAMGQIEQVEGYLCGALKSLKINRLKPDPMLYLTIIGLAKTRPEIFLSRGVTEHLLMFLKRETSSSAVKPKPNPLLTSMACNILTSAYQNEDPWPQSFIKVFVEDALGDRSWVDNEHCKGFVDNILASFGTVLPSKPASNDQPKKEAHAMGIGSVIMPRPSDEEKILEEFGITVTADEPFSVMPRYSSPTMETAVQYYIQDVVKEQLNKRQMIDGVSRNMLRFLTSVCGYPEVRLVASQKIEAWLQNPKLTRPSQELLMSVAMNCNTHTREDIEVIGNLIKMRLKTKPMANHYISCIKELVNQHPDNLGTTLKHVIYNELSQQRNPNNMSILQVIFQIEPENAAKYLALVFQDLLANREDYIKALKALFREVVRVLRFEINFVAFCRGLMQERNDSFFADLDQPLKDRIFSSLVSLICMAMLVSVSPAVKEIAVAMGRGEKRDLSVLQEFQTQISLIQRDAVWWFHTKVLQMFTPSEKDFISCLNKVLFLEGNECYQSKDSWPSENEVLFLLPLVKDVPLTEDALLWLLLLGLSEDYPMNCADTIDIVERLVQRSAVLRTGLQGLDIERQTVMEMVLSLCVYSHPKEISLPQGYQPPQLAISNLYWKGWTILLIIAACNPVTIGLAVWQSYPTARCMVEMIITRNYTFPPLATTESTIDEIKATELQLCRAEKDEILLFESHLAAATSGKLITEENSLLINQLISLDPSGPPRRPPQTIIEHLKILNKSLGLDYMFCKSRSPDFLLDIIHSQGSTQSMPWLADLVESSESSLNVLPSQCLCEFLLMKDEKAKHQKKPHHSLDRKLVYTRVVERLQWLLKSEEATSLSTREIMEYFFSRLQSSNMKERDNAVKALKVILDFPSSSKPTTPMETDETENRFKYDDDFVEYHWLLKQVPSLQHFRVVVPALILTIRQAMYHEMATLRLQAYILFVAQHISELTNDELNELIEDVSQLVTTRGTLLNSLLDPDSSQGLRTYEALLCLYASALEKSVESNEFSLQWSSDQEKVHVSWSSETIHANMSANLHVRVIHASIVLLACSPLKEPNSDYGFLLNTWFPDSGNYEVRLADTGEEALLLQDWLRMKMVISGVPKLVDTALNGLIPSQLVLFIQTFGLPVPSASKLLRCLDEAAVEDPVELFKAVVDRDYLYQLVEVQWARGATGGDQLCEFLGQDGPSSKQEPCDLEMLEETMTPFGVHVSSPEYKKEEIKRPIIFNKESLLQLLGKLFIEENIKRETIDTFTELKKVIAVCSVSGVRDKTTTTSLIEALSEMLQSDMKDKFVNALYEDSQKTCAILSLILKSKNNLDEFWQSKFVDVIKQLRCARNLGNKVDTYLSLVIKDLGIKDNTEHAPGKELNAALIDFLKKENTKVELQSLSLRVAHLMSHGVRNGKLTVQDLDMDLIVQACNFMQEKNMAVLKKFVDAVCSCFIESKSNGFSDAFDNIKSCVKFLVEIYKYGSSLSTDFSRGLILDWIEVLDPEIVHVDPLLQRDLLFMDKKNVSSEKGTDKSKASASYLRALLSHQSKDTTLLDCVDWLLSVDVISSRLNPTAALDLISSVVRNPKLWQGRDSKLNSLDEDKGRRINDEVMLDFSVPQLCSLAELILAEMEMLFQPSKEHIEAGPSRRTESEKAKASVPVNAAVIKVAEQRLPLILNHIKEFNNKKMERVANSIKRKKRFSKAVVGCFLHQIYLQRPNLLSMSMHEMLVKESADKILQGERSSADDFLHNLMVSVANTQPLALWDDEFHNLVMVCRRMAIKHPLLVIRHLPTLLSVVQGRHRMGATEFARSNQPMLFTQILSLLDILRPYLFVKNPVAQEGLKLSINTFIDLIQSYAVQGTELNAIVTKFVEFLNNFVAYDSSSAFSILSPESAFFKDLLLDHSGFVGLKFLCTFLSFADDNIDSKHRILSTPVIPNLSAPWTERQLLPFRQKLADPQATEAVLKVLKDLDETSRRRVDILPHFLDKLISFLTSNYSEIRDQAHKLLLRHYRHQPRDTNLLVDAYLKALQAGSQDVVMSAAKGIPELVLLVDDGDLSLLQKLFAIATSSRPEVKEFVTKSMQNLNIDLQTDS